MPLLPFWRAILLLFLLSIPAACNSVDIQETETFRIYVGNGVLSWVTPTSYSDGTELPYSEIDGFKVYLLSSSDRYLPAIYVSAPTQTASEISIALKDYEVPVGNYKVAVTTIADIDNIKTESGLSQEVMINLD